MRMAFAVLALCLSCSKPPGGVVLTAEAIEVDGELLVRTSDALRFDYLNIPELEEVTRERPALCAQIHAVPELPFRVVKRVMFSCAASRAPRIAFRTDASTQELSGAARSDIGKKVVVTASGVEVQPVQTVGAGVELSVDDDVPLQRVLDVAAAQSGPVRVMPSTS